MSDVHSSHCCTRCGCKYGNDDCTVVLGTEEQEYPCEACEPFLEAENRLRAEGAAAERACIVAWLRDATVPMPPPPGWTMADAVERGDHKPLHEQPVKRVDEVKKRAKAIIKAIKRDFTDRRGLRQAWDDIDDEIQKEIVATWTSLVVKELKKPC